MSAKPGFTLIEALVALAVLGATAGMALALQSSGLRSVRAAEETARAVVLARGLLEEVEFPEQEGETEGHGAGGLTWRRVIVREAPETLDDWLALYRVTVVVTHERDAARPVRLVTLRFSPVQSGGRR